MKNLGQVTIFNRPLYSASVADFPGLGDLELPSAHSVILLLSNAIGIGPEPIYSAASRLIERGAIYVCTWGADCERVHDIFDEAIVGDGSNDTDEFIMTTWHTEDSLAEAVDFFLTCAFPLDEHLDTCSWVAVKVGAYEAAISFEEAIGRAITEAEGTETQNKPE